MTPDKKAKKTGTKKHKLPPPGKESREVFLAALSMAKDLLKSNDLDIALDLSGRVDLVIDLEKIKAIPKEKFKRGLTHEQFFNIVQNEIDSLVHAATYSDPNMGIKRTVPSSILNEKGIDEFLWRLGEVRKEIVPDELRERAILRRTTQGLVLQDITWQVTIKKHDRVKGKLSDIPYACLSIIYASPQTNVAPLRLTAKGGLIELPTFREPKQLILELHKADVEQMIETLTDLRDNLKKLKEIK